MQIEELLSRLSDVTPAGEGKWSAKCPAHDDQTAILSASTGEDCRLLVHCHAGCQAADILQPLGLTLASLMPEAIDPISAYLGKVDSHNNAGIRALLHPLPDTDRRFRVSGSIQSQRTESLIEDWRVM